MCTPFAILVASLESDNLLNMTRNPLDPFLDHRLWEPGPAPEPELLRSLADTRCSL